MHPPWGYIWKHTQEKSQTNATNVTMHPLGQALWGYIWKHTQEKSQTNATNKTMHSLGQPIWGGIWKHTEKKIWTNDSRVTLHPPSDKCFNEYLFRIQNRVSCSLCLWWTNLCGKNLDRRNEKTSFKCIYWSWQTALKINYFFSVLTINVFSNCILIMYFEIYLLNVFWNIFFSFIPKMYFRNVFLKRCLIKKEYGE